MMSNRKVYWKFYFLIWGHFNHSRACKSYTVRLPLPSRVSLLRARSFLRTLLPSAWYAGYLVTKVFQNGTMFMNISLFYSHTRSYVTQWTATTLCGGLSV